MVPNVCRKTHEDLFREATSKREKTFQAKFAHNFSGNFGKKSLPPPKILPSPTPMN